MISIIARCPSCKGKRSFISYPAKTNQDLFNKQITCYYCSKKFFLVTERKRRREGEGSFKPHIENNIIKIVEVRYESTQMRENVQG